MHVASAVPLAWSAWQVWFGGLGVNPVETLTVRSGTSALTLLVLTLAVTPVATLTGWRWPPTVRRALGLWAFAYGVGHMLVFVGVDYTFDWRLIALDGIPSKPFILVGVAALLLMLPLAVTSTRGWQRRLGRRWKRLHRGVYVAAVLAVVHFRWATLKDEPLEPLFWMAGVALLLAMRHPVARRTVSRWRTRWTSRVATAIRAARPSDT